MGLIALIMSVVVEAIWPLQGRGLKLRPDPVASDAGLDEPADQASSGPATADQPTPHPLQRFAQALIDVVSRPEEDAPATGTRRSVGTAGWLLVVGAPVVLVLLLQWLAQAIGVLAILALHVAVLYLTVGVGAFHRQLSELRLLVGAGEDDSARAVLACWVGLDTAGESAFPPPNFAGVAMSQTLLAAYRDVFAPLFWYAVLPGAIGPVLYLFARFAARLTGSFAGTAYRYLDWIPLRLAALVFALVGHFEHTVYYVKAMSSIGSQGAGPSDAYLHQRLLLLPAASGALGLRLTDAGVDEQLRTQAPDLDLPDTEPEAASLRPMAGLLFRSAVVWAGIYLLAKLLG